MTYPPDVEKAMRVYMLIVNNRPVRPYLLWGDEAILLAHYGLARMTVSPEAASIETQLRLLELTEDGKALLVSVALQQDQP